jgi:hypothetical protein
MMLGYGSLRRVRKVADWVRENEVAVRPPT